MLSSLNQAVLRARTGRPLPFAAAVLQAARLGVANAYALQPAETGDCLENKDATHSVAPVIL